MYFVSSELPRDVKQQALMCVLVDNIQHPERSSVARLVCHEIVSPDVIRMRCPQSCTG